MRTRRTIAAAMSVVALTAVAACGKSGSPSDSAAGAGAPKLPTYQVKTDVKLDGSKAFAEAKKRGRLIIGAKSDQPFLGFEDLSAGSGASARSGFDIEIAKMVAADLGFGPDQIEWKTIVSANRENAISGGQIDYYVGTYTINPGRKAQVSFAGPYLVAGQDLLVSKDNKDITGPDSLKDKSVCTVTGSTSIQNIEKYGAKVTKYEAYSQCVDKLMTGEVDAVTTDDAILKGYAAKNPDKLKVVGKPFTQEPYGVGLAKDDSVLRNAIDDALKAHEDNGDWKKAYDATLGLSGAAAPAVPALDRY
ncbi:glutamate ABC transporter substrate-binding protein [Saccharothrix sp. ST-888]|uniref:glutamate ABC transporter substrate-binding protein n=1 Tax=Saccharothrix sp. ST-888 TaxID=1427391 RepID=UPI0005EC0FF2|nr:glutamate ABC transporter substrate-binding protein [Saccharothrix sp. ST-888]KJK58274.1 ABC transporter substrate-binding protein [Saccharothrix sp. ST-888]